MVGPAAGRVAARTCARRSALVPDPCDPYHRDRDRRACQQRRRRGPLPDYRSKPRRRHFSDPRIPRRRRPVRRRHGFQCPGRRGRRTASARIWPAVKAPRAQCVVRRPGHFDRPRAVRRCAGRRRPGARAADRRNSGRVRAPTSSRSTPRIPRSPGAAGIPSSTAGFLQRARVPSIVCGRAETRSSRGDVTGSARRRATKFNAAVRRLVA